MKAIVILPVVAVLPFKTLPDPPVIGVNRAAGRYPCSHFVAADLHVIQSVTPVGKPYRVFPKPVIERAMVDEGVDLQADIHVEDLFNDYPRSGKNSAPWSAHSATMALVLAASLGATQIEVMGLDRDAMVDIEGTEIKPPGEDEPAIVRHDLIIFDQTIKYLADRGVVVSEFTTEQSTVDSKDAEGEADADDAA